MHALSVLAVSGALFTLVAASPVKRDVVWETLTEEFVTTVPVTTTVWVDATDAPAYNQQNRPQFTGSAHSTPSAAPAEVSQPAPAPQAPSPYSSTYVAPAPISPTTTATPPPPPPAPETISSTSPVYVPPPATTSSSSSSAYVPPTSAAAPPAPVYTPAPASTSAAPAPTGDSGAPSGGTTYTGDITYYDVGLGSCGQTNTDSESVVAMAEGMMQKSYCGRSITISYEGNTHQATVVDTCPGCSGASLDLSPSLFTAVAPSGDGRVHGVDWWFD